MPPDTATMTPDRMHAMLRECDAVISRGGGEQQIAHDPWPHFSLTVGELADLLLLALMRFE